MSLESTEAAIDSTMATYLTSFADAQNTFFFLNGRYWKGGSTHTYLPTDGGTSTPDLAGTITGGEHTAWNDMVSLPDIPCALESRSYKKGRGVTGYGYVVKLKFIYSGNIYQRTVDSGNDASQTVAWHKVGVFDIDPPYPTSVSPSSGPTAGGTSITITGTGFIKNTSTTVTIGGNGCTSVSVVDSATITCVTPSGSLGSVDIIVRNADAQTGTLSAGWSYANGPTVTSLSVTSGTAAGGTSTNITGTGFVSGCTVKFGTISAASVTFNSATSLTVTTPNHNSGASDVTVTNPDTTNGTLSNGFTFNSVTTTYNSGSGNFSIPSNVTLVTYIKLWGSGGGGGGGDGGSSNDGGGGGGGAYCEKTNITVTGGGTIAYAVGAGGNGGSNADGVDGTNTTSTTYSMTAGGGKKGLYASSGGAGGTASGGTTNTSGSAGGNGGNKNGGGATGGNAAGGGGTGGGGDGIGNAPGGGGGGGDYLDGTGGGGAAGRVQIIY